MKPSLSDYEIHPAAKLFPMMDPASGGKNMSEEKHTPGPWRWEVNEKFKMVSLCGGKPQFDNIVMDFVRWGMSGAAPRFLTSEILLERIDSFAVPHPERQHHASWFKIVNHPDALLIAAAPDLFEACKTMLNAIRAYQGESEFEEGTEVKAWCDQLKAALTKATTP